MGVDIISVQSGGSPFRIVPKPFFESSKILMLGSSSETKLHIGTDWSGLSSTYDGLANYQQGRALRLH
jgi:hypothetical protein